jgi:hypothetical protein
VKGAGVLSSTSMGVRWTDTVKYGMFATRQVTDQFRDMRQQVEHDRRDSAGIGSRGKQGGGIETMQA